MSSCTEMMKGGRQRYPPACWISGVIAYLFERLHAKIDPRQPSALWSVPSEKPSSTCGNAAMIRGDIGDECEEAAIRPRLLARQLARR